MKARARKYSRICSPGAKEYAKRRVQYELLLVEYWVFCVLEDVSETCLTYLCDISREYKYDGKYELEYHVL